MLQTGYAGWGNRSLLSCGIALIFCMENSTRLLNNKKERLAFFFVVEDILNANQERIRWVEFESPIGRGLTAGRAERL